MTEDGGQRTDIRGQKSDDGGQRAEGRDQSLRGQNLRSQRTGTSPARVLTKGLVLGSSCSGEVTIFNQQTQGGGWAYEQDPISYEEVGFL